MTFLLALSLPPQAVKNWPMLALGAALLLFPLSLLFGKGVQYRELDRSWERYVGRAIQLPWHWVDFARAAGGTWLLLDALDVSRRVDTPTDKVSLLVLLATLCIAVAIQTIASKAPDAFNAPFAFVAGAILPIYPLIMAAFVLVMAILLARAFRSGPAFFGAFAVAIVMLGMWLFPSLGILGMGACASVLPLLLPILFQRDVVSAHCAVAEEPLPAAR